MNALTAVGRAIAAHPGLTAFGVGSAGMIALTVTSHDGKTGGLDDRKLAGAAVGVGLLGGLFAGGAAGAVGWGICGAGLVGDAISETQRQTSR